MAIVSSNKRIREIISEISSGAIKKRPPFQRRHVWGQRDKEYLIDTILKGLPFPEIYLADGAVDLESAMGVALLVDGQQRVDAIVSYFYNKLVPIHFTDIPKYEDLDPDMQSNFLQYSVSVRNLGAIQDDEIREIFQRINSTSYSLKGIEINNAVYTGPFILTAKDVADWQFFDDFRAFTSHDYRRMGDTNFILLLMATMLGGIFNRNDRIEEFLEKYNELFEEKEDVVKRLTDVVDFLESVKFPSKSRARNKANLFSLFISIDEMKESEVPFNWKQVKSNIKDFFEALDDAVISMDIARRNKKRNNQDSLFKPKYNPDMLQLAKDYYPYTQDATNNKSTREARVEILKTIMSFD